MESYKERLIEEYNDVKIKIMRLTSFITDSEDFKELEYAKRYYLKKQLRQMKRYFKTLGNRLVFEDIFESDISNHLMEVKKAKEAEHTRVLETEEALKYFRNESIKLQENALKSNNEIATLKGYVMKLEEEIKLKEEKEKSIKTRKTTKTKKDDTLNQSKTNE